MEKSQAARRCSGLVSTAAAGYKAVNYAQLTPVLIEALQARTASAEAKAAHGHPRNSRGLPTAAVVLAAAGAPGVHGVMYIWSGSAWVRVY